MAGKARTGNVDPLGFTRGRVWRRGACGRSRAARAAASARSNMMPCNETRGPLFTRRGRAPALDGVMLHPRGDHRIRAVVTKCLRLDADHRFCRWSVNGGPSGLGYRWRHARYSPFGAGKWMVAWNPSRPAGRRAFMGGSGPQSRPAGRRESI